MNRFAPLFWVLLLCSCAASSALPPRAVELNDSGVKALSAGDLPTAEARFALALELHPRFVDALVNLGIVEMQRGNLDLAQDHITRALHLNRHLAQPHHGLGVLAEHRADRPKAVRHYLEALAVDPSFAPSRANLARLYFEAGRLEDAREQFLRLVEIAPDSVEGYLGLVETLCRLGRHAQASEVLQRGSERLGDRPELSLARAHLALAEDDPQQAEALLMHVLDSPGPCRRAALAWLGVIALQKNAFDAAVGYANNALKLEPDDPLSVFVLALALSGRGDASAGAWLERARLLSPGNTTLSYEHARSIARAGAR